MPHFVPVYDPERPRREQQADPSLYKHRRWEQPHALLRPDGQQGAPRDAAEEKDGGARQKLPKKPGSMVLNERGLWVPAPRQAGIANLRRDDELPSQIPSTMFPQNSAASSSNRKCSMEAGALRLHTPTRDTEDKEFIVWGSAFKREEASVRLWGRPPTSEAPTQQLECRIFHTVALKGAPGAAYRRDFSA
ncbi:putative chemotaxis protein [Cyclospora cayetanensis]|uniref:Chemotaxis protein n=1 Tax=Cyclospora cayetanensis TaxID=88456 RepID=A0A1D3D628_9EIME|nr:putative chemotaxis protein [Cyclospora cayetanensis]